MYVFFEEEDTKSKSEHNLRNRIFNPCVEILKDPDHDSNVTRHMSTMYLSLDHLKMEVKFKYGTTLW